MSESGQLDWGRGGKESGMAKVAGGGVWKRNSVSINGWDLLRNLDPGEGFLRVGGMLKFVSKIH